MLSVKIDKHIIGDIAEECGLRIVTTPVTDKLVEGLVKLSVTVICGSGKTEFYAIAKATDGVVPPPVMSEAGKGILRRFGSPPQ